MLKFFERLINRLILLDDDVKAQVTNLNSKVIVIDVQGIDKFCISFIDDKINLSTIIPSKPNAIVRGTPLSLCRLIMTDQPSSLLIQKTVSIDGEIELLQRLKQMMHTLDIDWEEYLSRWIGDIPAHAIGSAAENVKSWGTESASNLRANFTEYLQEELQYFPASEQLNDFTADVDGLRDDVERLQARFERLQHLANQRFQKKG